MQNDVLTINLSTIKLRKIKVPSIEHATQNKSTNTTSTLIYSNQRFNYNNNYEDADFKTIKTRKNINSYFVKNPTQKLIEFEKEIKSRNRNILPILSNNYRSVKLTSKVIEREDGWDNLQPKGLQELKAGDSIQFVFDYYDDAGKMVKTSEQIEAPIEH